MKDKKYLSIETSTGEHQEAEIVYEAGFFAVTKSIEPGGKGYAVTHKPTTYASGLYGMTKPRAIKLCKILSDLDAPQDDIKELVKSPVLSEAMRRVRQFASEIN